MLKKKREIVLVVDNVRSVFNVASMFRTADACGVASIFLCGITPTPLDAFGRVRKDFNKTSLGAESTVAWHQYASVSRALSILRARGFFIIGLEQGEGSVSYQDASRIFSAHNSIALVVGNEVSGVSRKALLRCDALFEIPMNGTKESLNVSVATGIALYKLQYP